MRSLFSSLVLLAAWTLQPPAPAPAQNAPPDTEIFLAPLTVSNGTPTVGPAANITNSPGYDNQPAFTPDGGEILFTSIRGGTQTDIYRYTIASGATARVTSTPESEYSPTVTPDRAHISVIRVEADGTQRLWQFTMDGGAPSLVLADVKPVGYHEWVDAKTLVLFVLGSPATLQIADTATGRADVVARDVGRSIRAIPSRGTVSFVARESASGSETRRLSIRELDPRTRSVTPLVAAPAGAREADLAWTPDGLLLVAKDDVLYGWRRGEAGWKSIVNLATLGLHGVSRMAVSPAGDRIAFVTDAAHR
jgi:hypothetical protein